jgi:DNA polymerase I-like protein with 3'-5' exonuclease and polymerase domains/uracil-DNA glycosylase
MKPRGPVNAQIVFVTDAPSDIDCQRSRQCLWEEKDSLDDFLRDVNIDPTKVLFTPCFTGLKENMTPEKLKVNAEKYLLPMLNEYPRKLIVAMGNNALFSLGVGETAKGVNSLRGKPSYSESLPNVPIVPSIHPFLLFANPDENLHDFQADLRIGKLLYKGKYTEQVPMEVRTIETPEDIQELVNEAQNGFLAYDIETTGLDFWRDIVVSIAFCMGNKNDKGEYIAYIWVGYDRLLPCYALATMEVFRLAFYELFKKAGKDFDLVGWNSRSYDDRMLHHWFDDEEIPFTTWDGAYKKWVVNKYCYNGLKENVQRYLGYADYDGVVGQEVAKIAARRGRVMYESNPENADDFLTAKFYGVDLIPAAMNKQKGQGWKWPHKSVLDKKACAYALIDKQILKVYACYDAVYTWMLDDFLSEEIDNDERLTLSNNMRHRFGKHLIKAEDRGFKLDEKTNTAFDKECEQIIEQTTAKIQEAVREIDPSIIDFKVSSKQQLAKVLFGLPTDIPEISFQSLMNHFEDKEQLKEELLAFQDNYYGNYSLIKDAVSAGTYNFEDTALNLCRKFLKVYGLKEGEVPIKVRAHQEFLHGLYKPQPDKIGKTGVPSVAGTIIKGLYAEDPKEFLQFVLMFDKASKLKSTFISAFPTFIKADGRVHPQTNVLGTVSGRTSSRAFNSQNLPAYLRGQFIAREGYSFVSWDMKQNEVRTVAALSNDQALMEAVYSQDFHAATAAIIYGMKIEDVSKRLRQKMKILNFAILYGASAMKIGIMLGIPTEEAEQLIVDYLGRFEELQKWIWEVVKNAKENFYVETAFGTRLYLYNLHSTSRKHSSHAERVAVNSIVQGSAAELDLWMVCEVNDRIEKELGIDCGFVNHTHDSASNEVPDEHVSAVVQIVHEVTEQEIPFFPLNRIRFGVDVDVTKEWYGHPDLRKSIDPSWGVDGAVSDFPWALLQLDDKNLTPDEIEERNEVSLLEQERRTA